MENCDFSDFGCGQLVAARWAGLYVSEIGFKCTAVSRVYTEQRERQKTSRERPFRGSKRLVYERSQRKEGKSLFTNMVCRKASWKAQHVERYGR